MKVTNISGATIYLKDLRLIRQGQTEARRSEDLYVGPGASKYLPDTSDVIRSAQKGDLYAFEKVGKLTLNDTTTLAAAPGPGNVLNIVHDLGYLPHIVIVKKVMVGPVITWVDATGVVDIVHNATFTETTITNMVPASLDVLIRIG